MPRPHPLIAALGLFAFAFPIEPARAQPLDDTEMLRFMVQAQCLDEQGRLTPATPIDPGCTRRRAQTPDDPATYRRSDWNDVRHPVYAASGHQATDAILTFPPRDGGPITVEHTHDFGLPTGEGFGVFSEAFGDGGDVMTIENGVVSAFLTVDGGGGVQWFVGEGCRRRRTTQDRAWLMFADDVARGRWSEGLARLSISKSRDQCPETFASAYTRWIRADIPVPFRRAGAPAGAVDLDVIVSEHYDLGDIPSSTHLERFFFARDLGKIRWERWEHRRAPDPEVQRRAQELAAGDRCPHIAYADAPGDGWVMIECRMWTNIISPPPGWSARRYDWIGLTAAAR